MADTEALPFWRPLRNLETAEAFFLLKPFLHFENLDCFFCEGAPSFSEAPELPRLPGSLLRSRSFKLGFFFDSASALFDGEAPGLPESAGSGGV